MSRRKGMCERRIGKKPRESKCIVMSEQHRTVKQREGRL